MNHFFVQDEGQKVTLHLFFSLSATLHLYYARIVSHFLHQLGITPCPEPFQRLLVQGMVMGKTFVDEETGRYLKQSEIEYCGERSKTLFLYTLGGMDLLCSYLKYLT